MAIQVKVAFASAFLAIWVCGIHGCGPQPSQNTAQTPSRDSPSSSTRSSTRAPSTAGHEQTSSTTGRRTGIVNEESTTPAEQESEITTDEFTTTATLPPLTPFRIRCQNDLNGVYDGARCYYYLDRLTNWDEAWSVCDASASGAKLAQIMSSREMNLISQYLLKRLGQHPLTDEKGFIRIALKRNDNARPQTPRNEALVVNETFWYENTTHHYPMASVANTMVVNHTSDDEFSESQTCMHFFNNFQNFADSLCADEKMRPLCQLEDPVGDRYQLVNGACRRTGELDSVGESSAEACQAGCHERRWCRSFNFVNVEMANPYCQFFPWINVDQSAMNAANPTCQYYEYIP